jgi:centrosomal protein CEP120
VEAE